MMAVTLMAEAQNSMCPNTRTLSRLQPTIVRAATSEGIQPGTWGTQYWTYTASAAISAIPARAARAT